MSDKMGINHHITTAYSPWANGTAERLGRELLWTLRALLSERQLNVTDWDYILPAVQFALNTRKSPILGGISPIKAATGIAPVQPTDIVVWKGPELAEVESVQVPSTMIAKYSEQLAIAIDELATNVKNRRRKRRDQRLAREKQKRL